MFIEKKFGRMYLRGIDMNLTIRPLDPQHPEQLPNFFDSLDYSHAPHWSGCYCRFYHVKIVTTMAHECIKSFERFCVIEKPLLITFVCPFDRLLNLMLINSLLFYFHYSFSVFAYKFRLYVNDHKIIR